MTYARTDLEMAVQHIAEAEVRIAEQRRLITRYTALRRDTTLAVC